jgi:hypothetical protein
MGRQRSSQISRRETSDAPSIRAGTGKAESVYDVCVAIQSSKMHRRISGIVLHIRICASGEETSNKSRETQR